MESKRKFVFHVNGETYTNFKDYGTAIADMYFPDALNHGDQSAEYFFSVYSGMLEDLCEMDMETPWVSVFYNFCRRYYALVIYRHISAERLLNEYADLHPIHNSLIRKCKSEAITVLINNALDSFYENN